MISVVMPCFNAEQVAVKTIEDFANQRYKDFELIIVNDGSTDRSEPIIKDFIDRNNLSWTIISQPHKGVSAARNTGMDLAKGDYVVFCDSDDRFEKDYLLELHRKAAEDGSDAVFCGFDLVDKDNMRIEKIRRDKMVFTHEKTGPELIKRFIIKDKFAISMGRVLIRTSLIRENMIRFNEGLNNSEDQLFTCTALFYAGKVSYIDKILLHYVQYQGQSTKIPEKVRTRAKMEKRMFCILGSFLKRRGTDKKLTNVIENYEIPNAVIKDLSLSLRFGRESYFREKLYDPEYRKNIHRSQSMLCFRRKPETWLKGFELLYCPKLFYKHYINRKTTTAG